MITLREAIKQAQAEKKAIGHFNISNIEILWAIFNAARKLNVPVIIGTSEGERNFIGTRQAAVLVKSLREEFNYPIFLNADHTYSFEKVKEAVLAGYDSIIFDGTKVSIEDNINQTKECIEYAKKVNPEIIMEAELGFIGSSSQVLSGIPEGVKITEEFLTKPNEVVDFIKATRVDMVAPAVGNIHGMLKGGVDPALNIQRIKEIKEAIGETPIVLHGASGNSAEDIKAAIAAGVAIVHVNTELRVAYRQALEQVLKDKPDEVAPYRYLIIAQEAVQKVVEDKLKIFNNIV
ncbi:MAG: class II fructose-bisphosphate aldolase [bacterium]